MKTAEAFVDLFKEERLSTAQDLMRHLGLSRSSVTRHLKITKALTSVNSNGQYYTLPGNVKFNRYGLGKIDGKIFSRHGNLLKTIAWVVENSVSGMSPSDIEKLVETNVQSQCLVLFKSGKLFRKKYGKVYFYFSIDREKRQRQLLTRTPSKNVLTLILYSLVSLSAHCTKL